MMLGVQDEETVLLVLMLNCPLLSERSNDRTRGFCFQHHA
jgi:hypothetical protein